MKLSKHLLTLGGLFAIALPILAKSDLATPDQRREVVTHAGTLVQPEPAVPFPADVRNPFGPAVIEKRGSETQNKITGDREVLAAIAAHIVPSGVMQSLDGRPILLLREKKLKVGDYLTITFEGTDYMIELAAIDHSSFTLRLHKEEITQPLNP